MPCRWSPATESTSTDTSSPGAAGRRVQHEPRVVRAVPGEHAVRKRLLDQHGVPASEPLRRCSAPSRSERSRSSRLRARLRVGRDEVAERLGARPRARRVREHVDLPECQLACELHGAGERRVRLGRESHDHVGGDVEIGQAVASPRHRLPVALDGVGAAHVGQHGRVGRLQRDVHVAGDGRGVDHGLDESRRHVPRLDRRDAKPCEAVEPPDLPHEVGQITLAGGIAPGADVDAGEHQLRVPVLEPSTRVAQDRLARAALGTAARARDDAERATLVAAVLHLHEGARTSRGSCVVVAGHRCRRGQGRRRSRPPPGRRTR